MLMIVSGAFGIYRRELIEATGGWDAGPGEDADLTLKGRKRGARIAFSPRAVCWTKVPATIPAFVKQQLRWERSLVFYYLRKHNSLLGLSKPGFRLSNFLGAIDILFWQLIMSYSFIFYLGWLFTYCRHLAGFILLSSYLFYLALNTGQFLVAWLFSDYRKQDLSLFCYLPLYGLFSAYFLRFARAWAYTEEFCWRSSQRDPHVPAKVREKMVKW
jgi:cellulose synthase/poly-beta-1,6-N-acetylglucosamine synthase-like glycosyltransferase